MTIVPSTSSRTSVSLTPKATIYAVDATGDHPDPSPKAVVRLDVLNTAPAKAQTKPHSKMGRLRAIVLALVHVAILLHIAHWLWTGSSLSPLEPSEAMYTVTQGELNAGAVLFAVALLATLIFGRFFCGWACHVIALQDASLWLLKKFKLRPSPFRSRLLLWFPLVLALYMFVWPAAKRWVVAPAIEATWPEGLAYIGGAPTWEHLENAFIVEDYWSTFPTLWVAIPFIFVIGFGVVYTLGAKGFCTYACPYGGFFAPLDRFSPMRIVVDHDKCAECGVCTAVCTSNVRVSEEIKDFGMVVDPGCMKCLDCVSACPSDALAYRAGGPPILATNPREPDAPSEKKRRKKAKNPVTKARWDLTWTQELTLALIFFIAFISLRGLYGVIPMLFAGALAVIVSWMVWKAWRALTEQNVRIHGFQLRRRGRYSVWGGAYLVTTALLLVFIAHAALISVHWGAGLRSLNRAVLVVENKIEGDAESHYREAVERFDRVRALGLATTPRTEFELAMAHFALGEFAEGETALRRVIAREGEKDGLVVDLAQFMLRQGRGRETVDYLNDVLERHPRHAQTRWTLGSLYMGAGEFENAVRLYQKGVEARPRDYVPYVRLAEAQMGAGRPGEAAEAMAGALELYPTAAGFRKDYAIALEYAGRPDEALEQAERAAADAEASVRADFLRIAAGIAQRAGRSDDAQRLETAAREAENASARE